MKTEEVHFMNGEVFVDFPFEPYQLQRNYMSKVIEACDTRQFALLESPTGTGKTLSLICSVFSWKRHYNQNIQVIYASRTHSQLSNVIKELKKTVFRPTIAHIASRSHMCLIKDVKNGDLLNQSRKCRKLRMEKKCMYADDEKISKNANKILEKKLNMEDFLHECEECGICPYMCTQQILSKAELIISPYTYIVDPKVRNSLPSALFQGNIVIFDEAHNFPDQCCDYFSVSTPFPFFNDVLNYISKIGLSEVLDIFRGNTTFDLASLNQVIQSVKQIIEQIEIIKHDDPIISKYTGNTRGKILYSSKNASFIYSIFERAKCDEMAMKSIIRLLSAIAETAVGLDVRPQDLISIENVLMLLKSMYPKEHKDAKSIDDSYGISISSDYNINLYCFSPYPAFKQIVDLQPHTIILTSGTIAPFAPFVESLGIRFPIQLENPHVADPSQLYVAIVSRGSGGTQFNFTYQNRSNTEMKSDLNQCITYLTQNTPAGMLSFFPSFAFMDDIIPSLHNSEFGKKLLIEPRDQRMLQHSLMKFTQLAKSGACLFAVCRGKMSEGIDFSNEYARLVTVVGIPFPNLSDPKVEMHKSWLDKKGKGKGSRWYLEQAMRAVNQAIGRAIRHKDDYAAVLLFDHRYEGFSNLISKWIRPSIHIGLRWSEIKQDLQEFYDNRRSNESQHYLSDDSQSFDFSSLESDSVSETLQFSQVKESSSEPMYEELMIPSPPRQSQVRFNPTSVVPPDYFRPPKIHESQKYDPDSPFTKSQQELINPTCDKSTIATIKLKMKMSNEERGRLCVYLYKFKMMKDETILQEALDQIESQECRDILLNLMTPNMRARLHY